MKRTEKTGFQKKQTEPMGDVQIQEFLDMIAPAVIKFETDHFICGNTYRCVWALREYPTATEEQAILSHLGEKDGVTLRIYTRHVTPVEERKIISNAAIRIGWIGAIPMTYSRRYWQKATCRT